MLFIFLRYKVVFNFKYLNQSLTLISLILICLVEKSNFATIIRYFNVIGYIKSIEELSTRINNIKRFYNTTVFSTEAVIK